MQGISSSTANNAAGVYGVNNAAGAVDGVFGTTSSSTGVGVGAYASSSTGATNAVFGEDASSNGIALAGQADLSGTSTNEPVGVFGLNNGASSTGNGFGVVGYTSQASANGAGVEGENLNGAGVGVLGISGSTTHVIVGGYGVSGNAINTLSGYGGVLGTISNTTTVQAQGALGYRSGSTYYGVASISGSKSAIVETGVHEHRAVFCLESAENYFEDMGEGKLVNGHAIVVIDPTFYKTITIDSTHKMEVFITLLDEVPNQVYVKRGTSSFEVIESNNGTSNAAFIYRVAGHRKGYEDKRLPIFEEDDWNKLQHPQPQAEDLRNHLRNGQPQANNK